MKKWENVLLTDSGFYDMDLPHIPLCGGQAVAVSSDGYEILG
jgi:hypothetical protein